MISKLYRKVIPGIIGKSKKQLTIAIVLFVVGILLGYVVVNSATNIQELLIEPMQQKFGVDAADMSNFTMFISIFFNNLKVALLLAITGWIFGIMPAFTSFSNGLVIGAMLKFMKVTLAISPIKSALSLLPHGILEVPALLLICALSMRSGVVFFSAIRKRVPFKDFGKSMVEMVTTLIFLIIPAFLIASLIETFVSSPLAAILLQG